MSTLYWLLRSSVQKRALRIGEKSPFPACKLRKVGVQSDVVDSILMLEQRYFHVMEKLVVWLVWLTHLWRLKNSCLDALSSCITQWTKPLGTSLPLATLTDLGRSKSQLIAENALLRQQLIVLKRQVKRPTFRRTDRILLVIYTPHSADQAGSNLAAGSHDRATRHEARGFHRELFRLYWKRRSQAPTHQPKVATETIALPQADGEGQSPSSELKGFVENC